MTLNQQWSLKNYWKSQAGIVTIAEFSIVFTNSSQPGVTSSHAGRCSISAALISDVNDTSRIISACKSASAAQLREWEVFHTEQLKFLYETKNAVSYTDPAVVIVPAEISDRQFFEQLANMKLITEAEAIAAVATGTLPSKILVFVEQLPEAQQFSAKMALQGATTFLRSNPLVETFAQMQGMTSTQIDQLWVDAFKL